MGDDKGGAPLHQVLQGLLHLQLALGVQAGGGLVQDEHRPVGQQGPGDGQPLALPAEPYPALADLGVKALGQPLDEVQGIGRFSRRAQLFLVSPGTAVGDVGAHRVVEQDGLLGDDGDLTAQAVQGGLADIHPVKGDPPLAHLVKTRQQVHQGGLAAPAGAHQGQDLAAVHGEVDVVQHLVARGIGKIHALEPDGPLQARQLDGVIAVYDLRLGVEHLVHPVAAARPIWMSLLRLLSRFTGS